MTLVKVQDLSVPRYGKKPGERSVADLLRRGVVVVDKPMGPTSHQVSAWVRDMMEVDKAAHGGTLDPRVTGVLAVAFNDAVRALDALHEGDKEYICLLRLHADLPAEKVVAMVARFVGELYQTPPLRAAVKRELRTRWVYEAQVLEMEGRDFLLRVRCQAGTYMRTLCVDIGEALGVGAHMQDLRRIRTATLTEAMAVSLSDLRDAAVFWREEGDEGPLSRILRPVEVLLEHLPSVVVKDTSVDALCHGANLAAPGVMEIWGGIKPGDLVALYTRQGEGVALGRALMNSEAMLSAKSGVAVDVERVLMEPGSYPKLWR